MGAGVYSDNFNGTGSTFIVDCVLDREEGLEEFNAQREEDGQEPFTAQEHDELCSQDEWMDLKDALLEAGASVGLTPDRESWERGFMKLCSDEYFSLGIRSWEIDDIVGVWQGDDYECNDSGELYNAVEIACESMIDPQVVANLRSKMAGALIEIARIIVQESGRDCSFKTSGYTSARYPLLAEAELESGLADLQAIYKKGRDLLSRSPAQALREEGVDNYRKVMSIYCEENGVSKSSIGYVSTGYPEVLWGKPADDLSINEFDGDISLALSSIGVTPEGAQGDVSPLPETPEVMKACIEATASYLERNKEPFFCAPLAFWQKALSITDEPLLAAHLLPNVGDPDPDDAGPGF